MIKAQNRNLVTILALIFKSLENADVEEPLSRLDEGLRKESSAAPS